MQAAWFLASTSRWSSMIRSSKQWAGKVHNSIEWADTIFLTECAEGGSTTIGSFSVAPPQPCVHVLCHNIRIQTTTSLHNTTENENATSNGLRKTMKWNTWVLAYTHFCREYITMRLYCLDRWNVFVFIRKTNFAIQSHCDAAFAMEFTVLRCFYKGYWDK